MTASGADGDEDSFDAEAGEEVGAVLGARSATTWAAPGEASALPQRFGVNVTMNYLALATTALSSLLLTPLILHSLGRTAYGVWALAGGVVAYLELLELGFGRATTKLLAEDIGHRPEGVLRTINTNVAVLAVFGLIALVAGVVIAFAAPAIFDIPSSLRDASVAVFLVGALAVAVSIPFDAFGGALAAYQRYDLLAASNIGLVVATTLVVLGIVLTGGGLVALALGTGLVSLPFHVVRWRILRRLQPDLRLSTRLVERRGIKKTAALSWWFLVIDVSVTVILRVDLVVVGLLFGVRAVAVYAVGAKAAQLFGNALIGLMQVYFPHASSLARQGRRDQLRLLVTDGTRAALILCVPLATVLLLLSHDAIRAWVGTGYDESARILMVLTVALALRSTATTSGMVLMGAGRVRAVAAAAVAEAAVNLGASVALGLVMGPIGVAFGTLAGAAVVQVPWVVSMSCRASGITLRRFAAQSVVPHVVPAALGAAVVVVGRMVFPVSAVVDLVLSFVAVALYLAVYASFGATPGERRRVADAASALRRAVGKGPVARSRGSETGGPAAGPGRHGDRLGPREGIDGPTDP